jgi:hypothetical protein
MILRFVLLCLLYQSTSLAQETGEIQQAFASDQLEQLVAPIALYPDSLVAQILMAATYPLEIVQAARWREANPDLQGDDLEKALADHPWDPSVKALTNFPDVLKRMNENLDWTQDLGDAVLAQEQDVMDAVQRLRRYAHDEGNLETTPEQVVTVKEKVIVVEPATEVVYVPAYNPTVVYGSVWVPRTYYYPVYSYPPSYWYPPGYVASRVIAFGVGMAITAAIWDRWNWGHCDWRRGNITINNNFNFSRNINTANIRIGDRGRKDGKFSRWEHNAKHRGGVRYRDKSVRERYEKGGRDRSARIDRDTARGFDRGGSRDKSRDLPRGDRDSQRPSKRDREQAKTRDMQKPSLSDRERPQTRDVQKPSASDRERPQTRDIQKPSTTDRARPQTRDIQKPSTSDRARPQTRDTQRPSTRDLSKPQTRDRSARTPQRDAFDVGGKFDRAASQRGASSRGGSAGRSRTSGGGAARGGGGRLGR